MGFTDYVIYGRIGHLHLDITQEETLRLLGPPPNWLGKPPNIGFQFESYDQSDVWIYYNDTVGVRFGEGGLAIAIIVYPDEINNCPDLFSQWPISNNPNLGAWRSALHSNKLSFRESDPDSMNYWIVAEGSCVAFGLGFDEGRLLHGFERAALLIEKYSSVNEMERSCRFLSVD